MNTDGNIERRRAAARYWLGPALTGVAALGIELGGEPLRLLLRFDREGLQHGEAWRLISGHLTHLGWAHLGVNLAGLALLAALVSDVVRPRDWTALLAVCALAVDAGLYWGSNELGWYVGLSGLLHGIWAGGAMAGIARDTLRYGLLLALLVGKLTWETVWGPVPLSEASAGGPVVVAAHLYGAAGGAAWFALQRAVRRTRTRPV